MADEKIIGYRRVYVSDAVYERLAQAALRGGYVPKTNKANRRNVLKSGIDSLVADAIDAIEYHAEEIASHESED